MPDNVRTGFIDASRIGESDDEQVSRPRATKGKGKQAAGNTHKARVPTPEPEVVQLPFLKDVLLNKVQERELERKYQYVNDTDDAPVVTAPRLDKLGSSFPGPTRLVKHGRATLTMAGMMQRIHNMDTDRVQKFKDNLLLSELSRNADHLMGEPEQPANGAEDEGSDLPELPTLPKKRARKSTAAKPRAAKPAAAKSKPRGRAPRARRNSSDMEGDESEPEPTPGDMRLPTQGVDLGSDDTVGEDEDDEEPDSELAEFVVGSDAPIEMLSSSMPGRPDEDSDDLPEFGVMDNEDDVEEVRAVSPVRRRLQRGKRQVVDEDSDE